MKCRTFWHLIENTIILFELNVWINSSNSLFFIKYHPYMKCRTFWYLIENTIILFALHVWIHSWNNLFFIKYHPYMKCRTFWHLIENTYILSHVTETVMYSSRLTKGFNHYLWYFLSLIPLFGQNKFLFNYNNWHLNSKITLVTQIRLDLQKSTWINVEFYFWFEKKNIFSFSNQK